ncbi:MAG: hypothetical protein AB4426_11520, partial [Xenococcaceae cyanobacterium]
DFKYLFPSAGYLWGYFPPFRQGKPPKQGEKADFFVENLSPRLPVSPSPRFPVSPSPRLPVSPIPCAH